MILALASGTAGCGKIAALKEQQETIPVKIMKVELRDIKRALEYVGTIKGQDEAVVYPKVSGKIIEKVKEEGTMVNKGDIIAYIDRDEVGLKFEKAPIETPLSGVVGRIYVDIGANVTPTTPIAMIADMKGVEIMLTIPEKYLPEISLGQDADIKIDAYPNEIYKGKVTEISPVLDIETRSAPVEITIVDEKKHLQSGMFAKVKLVIEERRGVPSIIKEAVIGKEDDAYVYVIDNDTARIQKVALGLRQGPYYEVREGLSVGDAVVIMGQQRLKDKSKVFIEAEHVEGDII
jgi:multidrug efflux pump subunit AcrA (membrane-fusion protein)